MNRYCWAARRRSVQLVEHSSHVFPMLLATLPPQSKKPTFFDLGEPLYFFHKTGAYEPHPLAQRD